MNTSIQDAVDGRFERSPLGVVWGAGTHVGNVRSVNEDGFLALPGIWIVADGMGGHAAGRDASEITINICQSRAGDGPLGLDDVPVMLEEANRAVRDRAHSEGYEMMGTTICGITLVNNGGDDALLVFNVGDSRCYQMVEEGDLVQLTTDHSFVQELVDLGEITPEDARHHPNRNVISRAIGIEEVVSPDFLLLPKDPSSRLLLCSDGVSGELEDGEIATILREASTPAAAVAGLLDAVVTGPARDNATAIVLDVVWESSQLESGPIDEDGETTTPRTVGSGDQPNGRPGTGHDRPPVIDSVPGIVAHDPTNRVATEVLNKIPTEFAGEGDDQR